MTEIKNESPNTRVVFRQKVPGKAKPLKTLFLTLGCRIKNDKGISFKHIETGAHNLNNFSASLPKKYAYSYQGGCFALSKIIKIFGHNGMFQQKNLDAIFLSCERNHDNEIKKGDKGVEKVIHYTPDEMVELYESKKQDIIDACDACQHCK
ncbi:MAG: hypothetical protein FWC83_01505 [Alphaproteobacteria bacterium]|nr:hypothetical protein [Alphaproteobacteria bacterium]